MENAEQIKLNDCRRMYSFSQNLTKAPERALHLDFEVLPFFLYNLPEMTI